MITRKDITTGVSSDDYVEVMDGIEADEKVIRDIGSLQEGMTAQTVESNEAGTEEDVSADTVAEEGV